MTAMMFALLCLAATVGSFVGGLWAALAIGGGVIFYAVQIARSGVIPTALKNSVLGSLVSAPTGAAAAYAAEGPKFSSSPTKGAKFRATSITVPPRWLWAMAVATLAVFAVELPFAQDAARSVHVWGKLASIFLPLLFLSALAAPPRFEPDVFFRRLALALGLAALALSAELATGGVLLQMVKRGAPLTDYNRGMAHATIFLFPVLGGLWCAGQKRAAFLLALVMLVPASLTESRTAKMAMIAGYAVTALALWRPLAARGLLSAASLLSMAFPFVVQAAFTRAPAWVQALPPSWRHRVEIWDYLSYRIAERPWFGWGLGSTKYLDFTQPHGELYRYVVTNAPHAHNLVTQTWVETGVPGLACLLAFLILTIRAAARLPRPLAAFACGGWMSAFAVSLCGFDFWTDALWGCFALTALAFVLARQALKRRQNATDAQLG